MEVSRNEAIIHCQFCDMESCKTHGMIHYPTKLSRSDYNYHATEWNLSQALPEIP